MFEAGNTEQLTSSNRFALKFSFTRHEALVQ